MEGYEVITSDEKKVGRVSASSQGFVIVEHGALMKSRYALPKVFAHADDGARVVRITVSKEILLDSPKVDGDGGFDEPAVAAHYGLGEAEPAPVSDDPDRGPERDAEAAGLQPAGEERAQIRARVAGGGRDEVAQSPALLGDRTQQVDEN